MASSLHVVPFGDDALLLEVADLAAVRRLDAAIRAARSTAAVDARVWGTVVDQVPAATTVLLRTTVGADLAALGSAVRRVWADARATAGAQDPGGGDVVELPVVYDGEDLAEVAELTGLTVGEVVERHSAATYRVAFGGFMPGFAYLVGLDAALRVPRRATPRERVPRGAVAVADEFAAVYPAATPGGWRLLGRCDVPLFDVTRTPPALLTPGTRVRFVRAPAPGTAPAVLAFARTDAAHPALGASGADTSAAAQHAAVEHTAAEHAPAERAAAEHTPAERAAAEHTPAERAAAEHTPAERAAAEHTPAERAAAEPAVAEPAAVADDTADLAVVTAAVRPAGTSGGRRPVVEVVDPGVLTLVQDLGRPGWAHVGVGRSGAADAGALRLANRLVANPEGAAALELLMGGLRLRARGPVTVALAGAPAPVWVGGVRVGMHAPVEVPDGAEVRVGPPTRGLRTYLAVRGGWDVPPVLGSRATDRLGGIGHPPLAAGDVLPVGPAPVEPPLVDVAAVRPWADGAWRLPVAPGPHAGWFDRGLDALCGADGFRVTPSSDRVALRLDGPRVARAVDRVGAELPSSGLVPGAVQVPPDGLPVVFGVDHPVTGGYPVLAVVRASALGVLGQVRPGEPVRFVRA